MKKKILVVDDERQIVRLLTLRLQANNFDVIGAHDGYQCWKVAKRELPDLILLDIKMPLGGGINAFQLLKGTTETSTIPVIFIAGFPSADVKGLVMDMGADDFISKPFTSKVLIEKIKTILSNPKIKSDEGFFKDGDDKQKPFKTF
jgi:DNA-binding response OmpR family regulator